MGEARGRRGIHDKDTFVHLSNAFAVKVATLNSGSFAGHTDWRIGNKKELESILNIENFSPAVSPEFNTRSGYHSHPGQSSWDSSFGVAG